MQPFSPPLDIFARHFKSFRCIDRKFLTIFFGPYEVFSGQVRLIEGPGQGVQSMGGQPKYAILDQNR